MVDNWSGEKKQKRGKQKDVKKKEVHLILFFFTYWRYLQTLSSYTEGTKFQILNNKKSFFYIRMSNKKSLVKVISCAQMYMQKPGKDVSALKNHALIKAITQTHYAVCPQITVASLLLCN